jgi:hypothetical protein
LLEQLRQGTLDAAFDVTNRRDGRLGQRPTCRLPRFESMRWAAAAEVDEVVRGERVTPIERITPTHPSCVLIPIAGGRQNHRDHVAGCEIDRMTAIRHHESIGDAFDARHFR